jgi:hypothetical protein
MAVNDLEKNDISSDVENVVVSQQEDAGVTKFHITAESGQVATDRSDAMLPE